MATTKINIIPKEAHKLFPTVNYFSDTLEDILEQADFVLLKLRKNLLDKLLNIKKLKNFRPAICRVRIDVYRLAYSFNKKFVVCLRFRHRKRYIQKFVNFILIFC